MLRRWRSNGSGTQPSRWPVSGGHRGGAGRVSELRPVYLPPAPLRVEYSADRSSAGSSTLAGLARAAPQRDHGSRLSSVRCAPSRDRASRPQAPAPHREQRRPEAVGRGAAGRTVEPTANQPTPALDLPRAFSDVAMSRKHLPGALSAGIDTATALAAGSAQPFTAAHRTRSPARSSAHETATAEV